MTTLAIGGVSDRSIRYPFPPHLPEAASGESIVAAAASILPAPSASRLRQGQGQRGRPIPRKVA